MPFVTAPNPSLALLGGDIPIHGRQRAQTVACTELRIGQQMCAHQHYLGTPPWVIVDIPTQQDAGYTQPAESMVRYGVPGELVSGSGNISMGLLQADGAWKAGEPLDISCLVTASTATPVVVATALTIGIRDTNGVDPINQIGAGHCLVSTGAALPLQTDIVQGTHGSWTIFDPINIPTTPGCVGQVLLLQALVVDPVGGVYVSDIVGGRILP